ncbi:uncharacterized protein LOC109546423 [Dendroctonus ponderosae]|uniref:uncharacterized protein LOC109546423 n=1 Tax=Dendroctonus ponderosae TaxID=77166 RepID=UPI002035A9BB|nr:uncharacterized protein LOC109546423 [Dendroctonus ponderosae]KAH1003221.1 hypothetical protein HUJ05_011154 [Dendroctonus ponderosae]
MLPQPHKDASKISRIPQIAQYAITQSHVGRAVQVGEKAGVLRYVGVVQFAKGVWCGVELNSACGKNNGTVNGVWYFECAPRRGLMAPLAKVSLTEAAPHSGSGPYSILCGLEGDGDAAKRRRTTASSSMEPAQKPTSLPLEGDSGKRDSLDCEESLGILTPDQMVDFTQCSALDYDKLFEGAGQSPTNPEFSFLLKTDTTMNLELSLDPLGARGDDTPSPEELPLDATPLVKAEAAKGGGAKASSIITSITSITSLDTGYQGKWGRVGGAGTDARRCRGRRDVAAGQQGR